MFITASSTISHQPTFRQKGFSTGLAELTPGSEIIAPDYSAFIPVMDRRRMSGVLKMSIACAMDCLEQAGLSQPDSIIVGTAMGCPVHTRNFLDKIYAAEEGPLAPTNFIVSTHNTIAGQISMLLKNQEYNMTHTQNSLSFEQGLIDGILCIKNGGKNVLVGGCDEVENTLYNLQERLHQEAILITCGASFFMLSEESGGANSIHLVNAESFGLITDPYKKIMEFLDASNLSPAEIDGVLYANSDQKKTAELEMIFGKRKLFDYQKICGTYLTSSAFAVHYGIDILVNKIHPVWGDGIKRILVCNNLLPENLGLVLLEN